MPKRLSLRTKLTISFIALSLAISSITIYMLYMRSKTVAVIGVDGLLLFGISILLAIILGTTLARTVTVPISKLTASTRKVAQGDFSPSIEVTSNDEIGDLARLFKHMIEELNLTYEQLKRKVEELSTTFDIG